MKKVKYNHLKDNIWGTDLHDIQLISNFNQKPRVLCVVDVYS